MWWPNPFIKETAALDSALLYGPGGSYERGNIEYFGPNQREGRRTQLERPLYFAGEGGFGYVTVAVSWQDA